MAYGLIIKDASGNTVKITEDAANVVASGQATMPNALVDTDKYYTSVDLPGAAAIPINNVGCTANAFLLNVDLFASTFEIDGGDYYVAHFFASDTNTNYTKNLSTGVMTTWVPGDCSNSGDANDWDHVSSIYPDIYWDKLGASTVTAVKIFTAMRYRVFDASAGASGENIDAYQIGDKGVERADYAVVMQRKEVE